MLKYSIVVPFHNEEDNVTALYDRLKAVMEQVLADSRDAFELGLRRRRIPRPHLPPARRDRRCRLPASWSSSCAATLARPPPWPPASITRRASLSSPWTAICRHDPLEVPHFLAKLEEGYDVRLRMALSARRQHAAPPVFRQVPPNWLMAWLSGVPIHDFGTTFKAYRRDIIQSIPLYGEMHRFIPALASWYGAASARFPSPTPARTAGKSHYGLTRTFRVFFDLLTIRFLLKYMTRPLHFFGSIGRGRHDLRRSHRRLAVRAQARHPWRCPQRPRPALLHRHRSHPRRHPDDGHRPPRRAAGPATSIPATVAPPTP